jgi:hypothetical protein
MTMTGGAGGCACNILRLSPGELEIYAGIQE